MIWDLIRTYRQAFRMYMRTKTKPMTISEAEEKRLFWAKVYAGVGISSFIYCTYMTYKNNLNFNYRTDIPKDRAIVEKITTFGSRVSVYEGFKKVKEYDLSKPEEEENKS